MPFPAQISTTVVNPIDRRLYTVVPPIDSAEVPTAVSQMVALCRETEIYESLFRELFGGQPYDEHHAQHWLRRSQEGWAAGSHSFLQF